MHLWEDVLPAAHGHPPVPVLPEAKAGVRGEGRRHKGRDGDRQAGHRLEDQPGGEGEAPDQPAAENGTAAPPGPVALTPRLSRLSSRLSHAGAGIRRHPAIPGGDPRHRRPGGAL